MQRKKLALKGSWLRTLANLKNYGILKSLGLKLELFISNINCLGNDKSTKFYFKDIVEDFSAYFSNFKFRNPSGKYCAISVAQYFSHLELTKKFDLLPTEKDYIIKILWDIDTTKTAGIDSLPGRFPKDGADVLAKPVSDICNLSVSLNKLQSAFKLAKVKPIFKKGRKTNVLNYRLPILSKANTFEGHWKRCSRKNN